MVVRWNSFGFPDVDRSLTLFDQIRDELDRVWEGYERDFGVGAGRPARWRGGPRLDVFESDDALMVRLAVPGFNEEDIDVNIHQKTLSIRGERKVSLPEGYKVHRRERGDYSFSRTYALPVPVDPEKSRATLCDGVLTLELGKAEEVKPRQIPVSSS